MAALANVALTNTFDTWRLRTNALLTRVNQFTINESALYANTITANVRFVSAGSTRLGTTDSNRTIVNGLLTVNGNITVVGNTSFLGNMNLGDATTDLLTVSGRATIGTNLTVSGNTILGGAGKTQTSTGAWTHTGTKSISSNLSVTGNVAIVKAVSANTAAIKDSAKIGNNPQAPSGSYNVFSLGGSGKDGNIYFYGRANTVLVDSWADTTSKKYYIAANTIEFQSGNYNTALTLYSGNIINAYGYFGVDGRASISTNLFVGGNTTLNGTTIDKSNALSQTLTDGATITWDVSQGRVATVTLGGSRTMAKPTNLKVGTYILRVRQDGTGSRTITWNPAFKWTAQTAPVLTTTANAVDVITLFSDGNLLYGSYLPDMR